MTSRRNIIACVVCSLLLQFELGVVSFSPQQLLVARKSGGASPYYSCTQLRVSELHIPGYTETKLPFLASPKDQLQVTVRSPPETQKWIPYQDGHLVHKTTTEVFTPRECQSIIREAEQVASEIAWTTNRHGNFPTTDIPIVELPNTLQFLRLALQERIYPALRQQFGAHYLPDPDKLRVADGFVVKYDAAGGQKELQPHRDGSVLSFNIALNPAQDYEGGGTWFASMNQSIKIEQGHMVSHASALLHGGHGITSGTRYILVAFVILEGYDSWSMRFYNGVRNL